MIKATPSLTLPESVSSFNVDTFLFLKSYLNAAGKTENEFIIYKDQYLKEQIGAFRLPNYTAEELAGGTGANEYEKIIDKLHDLTITQLQAVNPSTTFTKVDVLVEEPQVEEVVE